MHSKVKRIGILAAKEFTSYAGIITSLMLGATYIPIHSKLPTDRIINIIEQSELDIIIFDSPLFTNIKYCMQNFT